MKNNFAVIVIALTLSAASMNAQPGQGTRFVGIAGPTVLTEAGNYTMTAPASISNSSGNGVLIMGSNITLDLNGQTISGTGSGVGVRVMGARNVVIRNGFIEGAMTGVLAMNSSNVRIENLIIRGSMGAPPEAGVLLVATANSVVANNQILNTALGVFVRGSGSFGNRIEGNTITTMSMNAPLGICYNPSETDPEGPKGDLITGNLIRGFRRAVSISATSEYNIVKGNTFLFRTAATSILNDSNVLADNTEVGIQ